MFQAFPRRAKRSIFITRSWGKGFLKIIGTKMTNKVTPMTTANLKEEKSVFRMRKRSDPAISCNP
jgi:hypothetical protein